MGGGGEGWTPRPHPDSTGVLATVYHVRRQQGQRPADKRVVTLDLCIQ